MRAHACGCQRIQSFQPGAAGIGLDGLHLLAQRSYEGRVVLLAVLGISANDRGDVTPF